MKLILATKNKGKVEELKELLKDLDVELSSLFDHPEIGDTQEDGITFIENAQKKARSVASVLKSWVLADDSGLEVEALNYRPGVMSARYAGVQGDYALNNLKLLQELKNVPDEKRNAAFVCAMVLISPDGHEWDVSGRLEGVITREPKGKGGFGYDPLFFVPEEGATMAELPMKRKNEISHRGRALRQIREILKTVIPAHFSAGGGSAYG